MLCGVLAIAAVAAGCGSGGGSTESSSASATAPTKPEFVKQADAICAAGNTEIEEEFEAFLTKNGLGNGEEPSKPQAVELSETVLIPNLKAQSAKLRKLTPPSGDESKVSALLDALEEGVEKAEEEPEALLRSSSDPFASANKQADEYGLTVCGR
jgi:hypothetical protein